MNLIVRATASSLCFILLSVACEPPPEEVPDEPPPPLATPYEVAPLLCDAGRVAVDGVGTCAITVTNVTDVAVNVTGATNGPPFIAVGAVGNLAPGESLVVTVNALPRAAGVVEGELALGPGRLIVPLVVDGFVEDAPEIIVLVSPDDLVAGDTVSFDSDIVPSAGDTFEWALVTRPAASSAALNATAEPVVALVADVPGDYTVSFAISIGGGPTSEGSVTATARAPRDLALTTTAGVLHFRPGFEELCGGLDCIPNDCLVILGNGPRQSPTSAGGGIVVPDLAVGSYRVALTLAEGSPAVAPTVTAFVQGALTHETTLTLQGGDAHEAFDIVVGDDGAVTIEDVSETLVDGSCN